ncbi:lipoprotein [Jeotgalibacillus haloalkalitolerans]|uniref:Lipoprotein n=1 Tax=Jeotgalibacillus haloalkalitolerans TaxID=3104292 RepID=A0ABU5KJ54_9BACL|nr:lipoprotein [Jeotgalibacillus sp. HH7-29]MDZ5711179.1 lipoprotein [Jeotgalibacillus sp. HH7-29]
MKKLLLFTGTVFLLTACNEEESPDYIFTGEGEHWEANLEMTEFVSDDDQEMMEQSFTLTFKGENEDLLGSDRTGEVIGGYVSSDGEYATTWGFNEQSIEDTLFTTTRNTALEYSSFSETETIEIFVEWEGGNEEMFEITSSE